MKQLLKRLFLPTKITLKLEHEVEECFSHAGIVYYKFVNEFNIPYERAMAALDIYTELEQRADAKYTKSAFQAIIEYLKKGDNINAGNVALFALQRMDNICNADLVYKLAGVLYFDASENPYMYNPEYADKKVKAWKKDKNIEAFFLKTPLANLIPSFDSLAINIQNYTEAKRKELLATLKYHLSKLSEGNNNKEMISTLELQIMELEELLTPSL